jgi:PAS domain S-box-containing protein
VRFIWACDAQSRLMTAALSPDHMLAPWAGQALLDNPAIREASGALAEALLDHKTFSNLTVKWHAPDGVLESQLSGAPVNDRDGQFSGYRGFGTSQGLVHTAPQQPAPSKATLAKATPDKATPVKATPAAGFAGSGLSDREQQAFDEIGRLLAQAVTAHSSVREDSAAEPAVEAAEPNGPLADEPASHHSFEIAKDVQDLLDRLPVGVLVSRGDVPIVMNRLLLQSLDYPGADEFHAEGAITRLFPDQHEGGQGAEWMALTTRNGDTIDMRVMFQTIEWGQLAASMMVFVPPTLVLSGHETSETVPEPAAPSALVPASPDPMASQRISELEAILDTATDGVVVVDLNGTIVSLNKSAQALFGYDAAQVVSRPFVTLFAADSHTLVQDYFEGFRENGVRSLMNDGREVTGQVAQGGHMPLFMTLGRTGDHNSRFCAVLRDLTAWKKVESDLNDSRKQAEIANAQKSDMLARISHELRTPLSAILGFAEVMVEERFGPIGNPRYQDYLRDIHSSGHHLLSLVNDLLDLAKIEAGKFDLDFTAVDANATVKAALGMIHPDAERNRVFVRSSLTVGLPKIVADERTLRQVVLNLLSNAVKFTDAGGQVIVTTGLTQDGEVVLRIRDTGVGMDSEDIKTALEFFRQTAAGRKAGGTGLGLPLTKALTEANRASFSIKSDRGRGTLIEITFPSNRVLAE